LAPRMLRKLLDESLSSKIEALGFYIRST